MLLVAAGLLLLAGAAATTTEIQLTLKSGQTYLIAAPATHRNGRVSFRTADGSFLSVKETDVASEVAVSSRPAKPHPSPLEDRQLGAIARERREETGKSAAVAPPAHPKKPRTRKKSSDRPSATSSEAPPDTTDRPNPKS